MNDGSESIAGQSSERWVLGAGEIEFLWRHLREGVLATDADDWICLCNPSAGRLLGISDSACVGQKLSEVISSPALWRAIEILRRTPPPRPSRPVEIHIDGQSRLLDVTLHEIAPDTSLRIRQVLYILDETESYRLARMKADFVANASHELRTPLATIKVAAETLLESANDAGDSNAPGSGRDHERRFLEVLHKNVLRLEELVRDLLALDSLESARLTVKFKEVFLPQMIGDIARDYTGRLSDKGIRLETDYRLNTFWADRKLLKVALANLIDNAIKFVPSHTGVIRIRSEGYEDQVILKVEDNGPGIPPQDVERVFERFYQVDKARDEGSYAGTGLGLAIVKHAIAAMNGSVVAESTLGVGTTFRILLPQQIEEE